MSIWRFERGSSGGETDSGAHYNRVAARRLRPDWLVSARRYGVAAFVCAVFSAIYESLSHGVISVWMVGLCAFPLMLGVMPALICGVVGRWPRPLARQLWVCGVMTLTMGSCLYGVLEIYGTSSGLVWPYLPVGFGLLALAGACF